MKRTLFTITLFMLMAAGPAAAADIYALIQSGQLERARSELSKVTTAATRDGDILFYQSMLEIDAAQSARMMEASLSAAVTSRYREVIYYRLAQYYLVSAQEKKASRLLTDYFSLWEAGPHHEAMLRLSVLLSERERNHDAALRQCDRFLVTYPSGDRAQLGQIDKARVMQSAGKNIGSDKTLRKIVRARSGEGIPQALYILGMDAARRKRADDAVFYYNLLREGYPAAVGLDEIVTALGGMSARGANESTAEQLTGTYYSVKVGVFSSNDNAKRQRDKFKAHDKPVDIKTKTISGKKYQVVYVGRFQNYQQALDFKAELETTHLEIYQVVAR